MSIIGIVLAYDQMRIFTPLWKVTLRYVSLPMCGVQFLMIRLLILSYLKVVFMTGVCQISKGEIGPTFGGCGCEYAR